MKKIIKAVLSVLFFISFLSLNNTIGQSINETSHKVENLEFASKDKDCSDTYAAAEEAYNHSRKAYNSETMDDMRYYLKKAMDEFEEAMSFAKNCDCDNAYSSSDDGYTYAKKSYNADNLEDAQSFAKKAINSADEAMSYSNSCSNE